ncbi:hypothetical protein EXM90_11520 [Clostridium botulinum]|uniref:hypothetical protein n=1 Tax=Clostridium botulinum TaxID=1491 RepID=UPI0007745482|nr:hypothetical protein [Clostridium botulinum]AUN01420.1 hypothetical protein RSJ19_00115 [Clostridium botulinum]MBN3367225.1 hypothetical protein [Clostridium botulinum]MBN3371609.1 hypothetical protein [Clostridium botulinum]MBN3376431.1 hypothetical protein [Clostridium botulinum]MBN3384242.1 hypothetical protein [Clostridium botulinum]
MNLKELLDITCVDAIIKIKGIKERNIVSEKIINCKNEYNKLDLIKWENIQKQYGENTVLHQYVEDNMLVILIKL